MTPAAIIALVRDVVILIALGLLIWLLIAFGRDMVKVTDMKAVQKQLTDNAATIARWREDQTNANKARDAQVAQLGSAIVAQRAPVRLCGPTRPSSVSGPAAAPGGSSAAPGSVDTGSGSDPSPDLRPQLNEFELKYETALADCRAVIAGWPQ